MTDRRRVALPLLLLVMGCVTAAEVLPAPPSVPPPPGARLAVFISDTHFGFGRDPGGAWHPMEDFRWGPEFRLFLEEIHLRGGGATDLVLNGDTFELWQSLQNDCRYRNKNLGCTEAEALARLRRVLAAHADELRALGDFAGRGENRVVIVPGNHDAALLFRAVADAVLPAIPAPSGRVRIANEGYWLSADRRVYAEHGHQIGKEVNRFEGWPRPFITRLGRFHLRRPWGEQFVQEYYNRWEAKYQVIDNIADETVGVAYGIAAEGTVGTILGAAEFFKFFLLRVSWRQFGGVLGENSKIPTWDIARIRQEAANGGRRFLVESFARNDPLRPLMEQALAEGRFPMTLGGLTDAEIRGICDRRLALKTTQDATVTECPRAGTTLGAISEALLREDAAVMAEHLENTYRTLALRAPDGPPFDVFVYSHTHRAEYFPLEKVNEYWRPQVVNTGAWQRVITPEQLEVARRGIADKDVLGRLDLDTLPACYSVVLVPPHSDRPRASLQYWRRTGSGSWELGDSCS